MPQKKNPDVFELTRGKAGTLIGLADWTCLPHSKDCHPPTIKIYRKIKHLSFKPRIFCWRFCLSSLARCGPSLSKPERMRSAIDSTMMATDLADYLVNKGVPFREAHSMAGKAVRAAGREMFSWRKCLSKRIRRSVRLKRMCSSLRPAEIHPKEKCDWRHKLQSVKNQLVGIRRLQSLEKS